MPSSSHQNDTSLKFPTKRYLALLALPLVVQLGALTPLFENSQFFAEDSWWNSLTGWQQLKAVALGWAIWIIGVTVIAALLSLLSRRWREQFWGGFGERFKSGVSRIGLRLLSQADRDQLIRDAQKAEARRAAAAGPPKGTPSLVPGMTIYGDIVTHKNLVDKTLRVEWRSNGLTLGKLIPSRGNTWEVHYGHIEQSFEPVFVTDEKLGRADHAWQGVEMLRQRDLQEGSG